MLVVGKRHTCIETYRQTDRRHTPLNCFWNLRAKGTYFPADLIG